MTRPVAGTNDTPLYQSQRFALREYRFDLPNGAYQVTLKFAEIYAWLPGQRLFSVSLEGNPVISGLDLYAVAGADTAYDRTFAATVSDGALNIVFSASAGSPAVNAIRVKRMP